MKTKIFVTSDSGIDYISHPYSISSISTLIKFFDVEEYYDYIDMTAEKFFNRLRYDSKSVPTINTIGIEYIRNDINIALESYDNVLMVINNDLDYNDIVQGLKNDYGDKIDFYLTSATGYILASMALECDKALKEEKSLDTAKYIMDDIYANSATFLMSPENDISSFTIMTEEKRVSEHPKATILYFDSLVTHQVKEKEKDKDIVVILVSRYLAAIENKTVVPFIMYSNKDSYYLKLLESKLLLIHRRLRTIKKIPISPYLGLKYGKNIIAIGYVKAS